MSESITYEVGQRVRILTDGRKGQIGKIVHPIHYLLSDTWVCFVKFQDGEEMAYRGDELELLTGREQ